VARINYSRAFDISRQFFFGDWTDAAISSTATGVTLNLAGARIVLGGNFTMAGSLPTAGTITSLTYSTVAGTPVNEFAVTGLSMSYGSFMDAMADNDFNTVVGNGADWISGSTGNDKLYGGTGNDRLEGRAGNDSLFGGAGNDTLDGGAGNDSMQGGSGNDIYVVDSIQDRIVELAGGGMDAVRTGLSSYTLGVEIENVRFTGVLNTIGSGNGLNNMMVGGRGNDGMNGLDGNDTLRGGNGHDTLIGGNGNDYLVGDAGTNAVTTSVSGISPNRANLPVTLSMTLPETPLNNSITVAGFINNSTQISSQINLALVVDASASMGMQMAGASVGDVNGNGQGNERIDVFIASFNALVSSLKAAGLGDQVRIALIPFNSTSNIAAVGTLTSDANGNGILDIVEAARLLNAQGGTNYSPGLSKAVEFFNASPSANNFVTFLSDGRPDDYFDYFDEMATLRNAVGANATMRSIGIEGAEFYVLDDIDNGLMDNSALSAGSFAGMTAALSASQVNAGDISRLEVYKNGVLVSTILPSQLTNTPFGLRYSTTVTGLSATGTDDVEVRLILNGSTNPVYASQQISAGALVSNDGLEGGAGNDTLEGGTGIDTLAGGMGNDVYRIGNNAAVIRELAGQGTDTVESTVTYSLNSAVLQYVENLTLVGVSNVNASGNANANRVEGNIGNNVIDGMGGNDTLLGGFGFDTVTYVNAASGVTVRLGDGGTATTTGKTDHLSGFEAVWGSAFADWLIGDSADETFRGNGGDDTIIGEGGLDTLDYSTATAGMTVAFTAMYLVNGEFYGSATCANGSQGTDYIDNATVEAVMGSAFNDDISDDVDTNNKFWGGAGDDTLSGGGGNDTLFGGTGKNVLQGGSGVDTVDYSDAAGAISGSLVTGRLAVGTSGLNVDAVSGVEILILGKYADSVTGSAGNDSIIGGAGNDTLTGVAGNDTLFGGNGDDSLVGGAGNDVYYLDSFRDVIVESQSGGTDTVYFDLASGTGSLNFAEVENIYLWGGASLSVVGGVTGNEIHGGGGDDTINGGTGSESDNLYGGTGSDWLSYANHVAGVAGQLNGQGRYAIDGDTTYNFENFLGSAFADNVHGDRQDNILNGGAGNDTLDGDAGNDTLVGGAGNDSLMGGYGTDTVSYAHLTNAVTVNLSTGVAVTTTEGTDILNGVEIIIGGLGNDVIAWTSNTSASNDSAGFRLDGGAGNDSLKGSSYSDTLVGGAGDDVLDGGEPTYNFNYIQSNYVDYSNAVAAVVVNLHLGTASGGAGNDRLISIEGVFGSRYADQITGGSRQGDYLAGGGGADTLDGGIDTYTNLFVFSNVSDSTMSAMDTVRNFKSTDAFAIDKIDLSAIDANMLDTDTDSGFNFVGTNAFTKTAGQLRYGNSGGNTFVYGDVDGDGVADIAIKLFGTHTLTVSNFLL
jgi:Ca2+-binding RTX toxin-like protein